MVCIIQRGSNLAVQDSFIRAKFCQEDLLVQYHIYIYVCIHEQELRKLKYILCWILKHFHFNSYLGWNWTANGAFTILYSHEKKNHITTHGLFWFIINAPGPHQGALSPRMIYPNLAFSQDNIKLWDSDINLLKNNFNIILNFFFYFIHLYYKIYLREKTL